MSLYSLSGLVLDHQNNQTLAEFVHDQLRAMILSPHYTCVGAKVAFSKNAYLFGMHEEMGSAAATRSLFSDLYQFIHSYRQDAAFPSTFVASFNASQPASELQFEALLWRQLEMLQSLDPSNQWDSAFSDDPESPHFSFSIFEKAFFVVGLHPTSSRWARRFAWPTLVFNAQDQFTQLKAQGSYSRMETVNRRRDERLQGSINPNITDFGTASEARQYSGRHVEKAWKCPFHRQ